MGTMRDYAKEEKTMKCVYCNKEMDSVVTAHEAKWGKYRLLLDGINLYKCPDCGRKVFSPEEAAMVQNLTKALAENLSENKPDFLNILEVADILRVSKQTVYNMIRDGRINAFKCGREWRFRKEDILDSIEGNYSVAARGDTVSTKDPELVRELLGQK